MDEPLGGGVVIIHFDLREGSTIYVVAVMVVMCKLSVHSCGCGCGCGWVCVGGGGKREGSPCSCSLWPAACSRGGSCPHRVVVEVMGANKGAKDIVQAGQRCVIKCEAAAAGCHLSTAAVVGRVGWDRVRCVGDTRCVCVMCVVCDAPLVCWRSAAMS